MRSTLIGLALALFAGSASADLKIIALGDMPYGAPDRVYPPFEALIAEINAAHRANPMPY